MQISDQTPWVRRALLVVVLITVLRLGLLAFNRTDLFVDEAQYWLWGQDFAFGYFSKPPLIAWVVGAVTSVVGDAPFWVRAPACMFHGATALILGALAARMYGGRAAFWVAVAYVTLPFVGVGSLLMSTDTIMAPFFAAALYFHRRLVDGAGTGAAIRAGAMAGVAFLAKYAAVYFLIGVGIAALLVPAMRLRPRHAVSLLAAFGLVILPNVLWNLNHDLTTLAHTMDNVGWLDAASPLAGLDPARMAEFLASQFAVFGPVMFAALIWSLFRPARPSGLAAFSWPALLVVSVQAMMEKAYANWAVAAYFGGTVIAVARLLERPRLLQASVAVNGAICVILPLLTLAPGLTFGRDAPLLDRYLGRADLSRQIIAAARQAGNVPVVADSRDVLADLFYTGAASGLTFYAYAPQGRAMNHYMQTYPLPIGLAGQVLFVTSNAPVCTGVAVTPTVVFQTEGGAYQGDGLTGYLIKGSCLDPS